MADSLMPEFLIGPNIGTRIMIPFNDSGVLKALKACTHRETPSTSE